MARPFLTDIDFGGVARVVGLPDPTAAQHAATKAYVDSAVEGLAWKDSARVAAQANVNLAAPGASIDAIALAAGDRVLVASQTAAAENGIYVWNGAATPMTRALDANTAAELEQAALTVEEGTNAGVTFRQTAVNFTLGTTSVAFTTFGTSAPATSETQSGIIELATQAEVNAGADTVRAVTPATLAAWSGRLRKIVGTLGDGSATQFTITHNLATFDVQVALYRNSGNREDVIADVERTGVNAVRVTFAAAPTAAQYAYTVIG